MSLTCRVIPFENCTFTPQLPEGCDLRGERILLHCCCAPCSTAIIEWMVSLGLRPAVFFSNSNIVPIEEYELRRSELERYCKSFGLEVIDDEYNHSAWLETLCGNLGTDPAGLAGIPERGPRCLECFRFRLVRAAAYAEENGYTILTTTLASSRWKDLAQVDIAGKYACSSVGGGKGKVKWWNQNWRKGGLQERRNQLIQSCGIYNQTYCGCEFSERHG